MDDEIRQKILTLLDQHRIMTIATLRPDGCRRRQESTGLPARASTLYNLVPYQRRAQHAGQCAVEVEGGTVPTRDWLLNIQIFTSGGFR